MATTKKTTEAGNDGKTPVKAAEVKAPAKKPAAKPAAKAAAKPAAAKAQTPKPAAKQPEAAPKAETAAKQPETRPAEAARPALRKQQPAESAAWKRSVLFAAGECQPFAGTGGLGDVIGSLPVQLAKQGMDVRVVIPLYGEIGYHVRQNMTFLTNFNVALGWRNQYCGIFELKQKGVTYYFIDNEYYFKREGLYGHFDDGERFAFFSKAVIELMLGIGFVPDILHLHDWQTGLVPVYLKTLYNERPEFSRLKTVYTIHNIEYQGKYGMSIMEEVFGIPQWARSVMEYDKCVNVMKAAVVCSDMVTTVSPTYAKEILSPQYSHGLHYIMESNKNKLRGILNGIDDVSYNPETDKALFAPYSAKDPSGKALNKAALQKMLNLTVDETIPMLGIVTRLVSHKGMDLVKCKIEEILAQRVQVVMLGKGDIMYERFFADVERRYGNKMKAIIAYNQDLSRKIYAASDLFLMPSKSEPCGLSQMIASRYGAIPIVRETGGLFDSIKDFGMPEGGNGYVFAAYNGDDMMYVLKKALRAYGEADFAAKVKRVMNVDFSWARSAEEYIKMYRELC